MAARPRKHNVSIPNLYCKLDKRTSRVYWQYRHPVTGIFVGFGTNEDAAKAAASEMNRIIAEQETQQSYALIDMAIKANTKKENGIRVSSWIKKYLEIQSERVENNELSKRTLINRKSCALVLEKRVPNLRLKDVDTKIIATIVEDYKSRGKLRMGQLIRAVLIDVFKEAQHAGEVPPGYNPALAVRNPTAKVQRSRMTLEQWTAIFEAAAAHPPCAQNAMLLALVTGQRRGDLIKMKFSDVWDGFLHIEQSKTGAKIALPLTLRCEAINMSLGEVIARCRDRVISKYMLHHVRKHSTIDAGDPVNDNTITRMFMEARNKAGIKSVKGATPPSFHEQRSLASRLYTEQGIDVKALLGHSTDAMSEQYKDDRGLDWKKLVV
ncbi:site-specific integrase [Enterobacter sp. C2]|uniref:site-specific integrase n=1 Tax=Enterobacter sp. C2 TaxID=2870346 RepID=UPI001CA40C48|nr:site-specific integrase [Enterobacter sp. C2]WPO93798.1 phage integrase Arm DNA-binding domain-containing protein [Buttiauxella sp. HR94]